MGRYCLGANQGEVSAGVWRYTQGGKYGGEFDHTLTWMEMPKHNHTQRKEMPNKGVADIVRQYENGSSYGDTLGPQNTWVTGKESLRTADAGGDTPHNNTPPYYAVYWWHRTA